jgi:hypothetical protein
MEFLRKELSNKNKIKIKTFSELHILNVNKTKKFPILILNTQTFRYNSQSNGKNTLNKNKKEKRITERKEYRS